MNVLTAILVILAFAWLAAQTRRPPPPRVMNWRNFLRSPLPLMIEEVKMRSGDGDDMTSTVYNRAAIEEGLGRGEWQHQPETRSGVR